jgi:(2R)-3-sulfolactate dehydrogenase (NADP+)
VTVTLTLAEAEALAIAALLASRTSSINAAPTARALVAAEADGQKGHGMSRIPSYAAQAKAGKVDGFATPSVRQAAPAALVIDGGHGFAYPAIDLALEGLAPLVKVMGIAAAAISRSHHFGQAGAHAERLARAGLIALVFGNAPKAMPFWGGTAPKIGTNPIAFACPTARGEPLVIDLALSVAARGKIMAAEQAGQPIPLGWALDSSGRPTTDASAAMAGAMLPIGGAKDSGGRPDGVSLRLGGVVAVRRQGRVAQPRACGCCDRPRAALRRRLSWADGDVVRGDGGGRRAPAGIFAPDRSWACGGAWGDHIR